ncbi:hypothetical protein [Curvivirga sp.]|uniref:hypothetical protein n=1 Tax=Curvivirga sp. TaxID=2856848 RepID=UPI003B5A6619
MRNSLKSLIDFTMRRIMGFGGDVPRTEDVQNSILKLLQDHGKIEAIQVVELLYNNHARDRMVREVLQAAQILVNHGQILAFDADRRIDPVYGNEATQFKLVL